MGVTRSGTALRVISKRPGDGSHRPGTWPTALEPTVEHSNDDPEVWRPVMGQEGFYEVSSLGRVRSLTITVRSKCGWLYPRKGRLLCPQDKGDQSTITMCRNGKNIHRLVHHLVLEAFVGPCPDGLEACHNNGVSSDNRLTNLRWDTHSANMRDQVTHGTHRSTIKTLCPRGHKLISPNLTNVSLKRGERACKACHRALSYQSWANKKGIDFDLSLQDSSDSYYRKIMGEAHAA